MKLPTALAIALAIGCPPLLAQDFDPTERAEALATRRAERDAERSQRRPSRPITLRGPLPLPVVQNKPIGGPAVGQSCPAKEPCRIRYDVPSGKLLVVTAAWSASDGQCDEASLGATPPAAQVVAPHWHCGRSFTLSAAAGGGFTGYLADAAGGQ